METGHWKVWFRVVGIGLSVAISHCESVGFEANKAVSFLKNQKGMYLLQEVRF